MCYKGADRRACPPGLPIKGRRASVHTECLLPNSSSPRAALSLALLLGILGTTPACSGSAPVAEKQPVPAARQPATVASPAGEAQPAAAASPDRPLYYDRALTDADLDGRSLRELSLMRNTIFARAGNPFAKPWLDAYFRAQPWYRRAEKLDPKKLSDIDVKNAEKIAQREQSYGTDRLQADRDAILARGATPSPDDLIELELISVQLGEYVGPAGVAREKRNPLADPSVLDGQLSLAQVQGLSRRDLRLLRNTIYARHGRPFKSPLLAQYFELKDWYEADSSYTDARLTALDKRNIQLVKSEEDRLGGPLSEWDHEHEEGWMDGA